MTLVLVGCGRSSAEPLPSGGTSAAVGVWALESINAKPLPYVEGSTTVMSGTLTIRVDGSYSEAQQWSTRSVSETGTWALSGGSVTFNDATNRVTYTASIGGAALTKPAGSYSAATWIYHKQ